MAEYMKEYVLITGSSSGIGEEIAKNLSTKYNVILNGRDKERLESVKEKLQQGEHLVWLYDLSETDSIETEFTQFIKQN
ncbi:MAG: SDR family NAD(P)-dependent oxidoreductase, partial [Bacteroidaceae bacterium]|nr:SDR family NAD(P)-dependent oxidoreductase [Bacteroidaceae bacterium]